MGLFVTMMVVIVTSVVCRRKQRNNFNNLSSSAKKNLNQNTNGSDSQGTRITEDGKNNIITLKQYYPEGESLLSSETSNCHISGNEASIKTGDVNNSCDITNSTIDGKEATDSTETEPLHKQPKKLLISEV